MSIAENDIEPFENVSIDLPFWFYDEETTVIDNKQSLLLLPNTREHSSLKKKIKKVLINDSKYIADVFYKTFNYLYEVVKAIFTLNFFAKESIMPENPNDLLSNTEFRLENFNNIIATLQACATKAEKEHDSITAQFKNMKDQIKSQEESLTKSMDQINALSEDLIQANTNSTQQNKIIAELENELKLQNEKLSSAETKLNSITEQLLTSLLLEGPEESKKVNNIDDNYVFIVDHIQEMKNKIQQQSNVLKNVAYLINSLNELNNANKNIVKQNRLMKNLKDGLRQKSDSLLKNLRCIANQSFESPFLEVSKELEESEEYDENFTEIAEDTRLFLEDVNTTYEMLEDQKKSFKQQYSQRLSDIFKENVNITVIHNKINNLTTSTVEEPTAKRASDTGFLKQEVETQKNKIFIESSCQTVESYAENNSFTNSSTIDEHNALEALNSLHIQLAEIKGTLDACKLEKSKVEETLDKTVSELQMKITTLTEQDKEKVAKISTLIIELESLQNLKKENENLKDLLNTKTVESENLKKQIAKASKLEQDKNKKIENLREAINVMKHSHEETVKFMEKEAESTSKDVILMNEELVAEQASNKNLKSEHKKVVLDFEQRIQICKLSLKKKQTENEKMQSRIDTLNKELSNVITESENTIKKKNDTILTYQMVSKVQTAEIDKLKGEVSRMNNLLQREKENYRSTSKRQTQNALYDVKLNEDKNSTDYSSGYERRDPKHSNITYRRRYDDQRRK